MLIEGVYNLYLYAGMLLEPAVMLLYSFKRWSTGIQKEGIEAGTEGDQRAYRSETGLHYPAPSRGVRFAPQFSPLTTSGKEAWVGKKVWRELYLLPKALVSRCILGLHSQGRATKEVWFYTPLFLSGLPSLWPTLHPSPIWSGSLNG